MARTLQDKVIIITGASSGIGAATALECAESGMKVIINGRRADRLEAVAARIQERGGQAEIVVGDVGQTSVTEALLDTALRRFDRFDAVFANAGYGVEKSVVDLSIEQLRHLFEVNFFASVHLVQEAARRLIAARQSGHLLMCSSCLAKFTLPGYSAYSATKAAQNHFCRAMRIELIAQGIDVSSVHPITTATEFHEIAQRQSGNGAATTAVPSHAPKLFVQSPERVARAVVKCLRRPKAEVWTNATVRATAAMMTLSPSFTDMILRRAARRDGR